MYFPRAPSAETKGSRKERVRLLAVTGRKEVEEVEEVNEVKETESSGALCALR